MSSSKTTRRQFVGGALATVAMSTLTESVLSETRTSSSGISTRPLGKTGERVSILCLGGSHIGDIKDADEAARIMHEAMDQGITFFDNAWDYHGGWSEEAMGRALAKDGRRKKVFLMTKNCERDYDGSKKHLEDSLRRLRTDYLDLWQFHETNYDNDPDWVFEKGGIKAAIEAQKAGKVRYLGFTGHKDPRIHLKMLSKPHPWDTAQMPINILDFHYRSFQKEVLPVCLQKGVGVLGMKSLGGGHDKGRIVANTGLTAQQCIRYSLSLPIASLVVGINSWRDVKQDLEIARSFKPMEESEKTRLLASIGQVATDGRYELFKSSSRHDGPHHRSQHGFELG